LSTEIRLSANPYFKEYWTTTDVVGHAAGGWGLKSHRFLSCLLPL
jgi:hypothetical protein